MGALVASLFFGGWRGPGAETFPILGVFYLFIKAFFFYWVIMWIKYSMPRIRIDHMLNFNWKFLVPLSLITVLATALAHKLLMVTPQWIYTTGMFLVNLVIVWVTLTILRRHASIERQRVAEPQPIASPEYAELRVAASSSGATTTQ
jgi:NADH-quinone oxidoreductase subunit H